MNESSPTNLLPMAWNHGECNKVDASLIIKTAQVSHPSKCLQGTNYPESIAEMKDGKTKGPRKAYWLLLWGGKLTSKFIYLELHLDTFVKRTSQYQKVRPAILMQLLKTHQRWNGLTHHLTWNPPPPLPAKWRHIDQGENELECGSKKVRVSVDL